MLLASSQTALFDIAIATDAPPAVRYAAEELQRYVDRIAQSLPAIRTDNEPIRPREVLVGDSSHRRKLFPDIRPERLGREDYVLRTSESHLLALGGSPRGTLYAVYDLLERLGVRWWTPWEETIPSRVSLEIDRLDVEVRPPLIYRATWYREAMDADWQARMRLDAGTMGPVYMQDRHGGMERFAADASGHTYGPLVPVNNYFDAHPEYYSEVKGVRLRHTTQLCCTNPEVADIAADTIRQWMRQTPDAPIVSVTQNDWGNWCTCPKCAAMIEREGAPSGPALHLANEVAKRLEKDFPNLLIDTFAYSYTQTPPKHIAAHPNVLVRLAPIGNCFGHPIRSCPVNVPCREAVEKWSRIARHLFVWHYVTDFFHYLAPFPNLPPFEDDLHFYLDHGLKGCFLQGDGTSLGGDMAELKAYFFAKLMWNPSLRARDVRAEFVQGYYRSAGDAVEDFVSLFEKAFARAGKNVHLHLYRTLWDNEAAYLERPILDRARKILAAGRKAAQDDPAVLARLDRIEATVDYTELFYYERPAARKLLPHAMECKVSARRDKLAKRLFAVSDRRNWLNYAEQYGRYTTMGSLRRAWVESTGKHEAVRLKAGGARLTVVPRLGGRIVEYGPASSRLNLLGQSSTKTFGYPCAGGYEQYSRRPHQSPGFSEHFEVVTLKKAAGKMLLRAGLETGLVMMTGIRLDPRTGEAMVSASLQNPHGAPLFGCLRTHLEIDLGSPADQLEWALLNNGKWEKREGKPGGTWFESDVPDGWAFWSPKRKIGMKQTWFRSEVGAIFLGGIPAEPTVLALDLAHARDDETIQPGGAQGIAHRFGWIEESPGA